MNVEGAVAMKATRETIFQLRLRCSACACGNAARRAYAPTVYHGSDFDMYPTKIRL
jgi:hypothetical protein